LKVKRLYNLIKQTIYSVCIQLRAMQITKRLITQVNSSNVKHSQLQINSSVELSDCAFSNVQQVIWYHYISYPNQI